MKLYKQEFRLFEKDGICSEWTDFIQEKPSPLLHNTNKFIEYIEGGD